MRKTRKRPNLFALTYFELFLIHLSNSKIHNSAELIFIACDMCAFYHVNQNGHNMHKYKAVFSSARDQGKSISASIKGIEI